VVRPLVQRVVATDAPPMVPLSMLGEPGLVMAVEGGPAAAAAELAAPESPARRVVEFATLNGKVQAETIERVVDIVKATPTETVEVLRTWINDH